VGWSVVDLERITAMLPGSTAQAQQFSTVKRINDTNEISPLDFDKVSFM
jgi:hypothetical protein